MPHSVKHFRGRRGREPFLEPLLPLDDFGELGSLAIYATPPSSPAASRKTIFDSPLGGFEAGESGGMDDERQRRPYEHSTYLVTSPRGSPGGTLANPLDPRAGSGGNVTERLGQSQMVAARNPGAESITNGDPRQDLGNFGYPQGQQYAAPSLQTNSLQFHADYAQVTQRQQQYSSYPSQGMYNVSPQSQQPSPYDPVPNLQPRPAAGIEVLSSQLGVPQYYNTGETTSAPVLASMTHHYAPTQFQQPLQYQPQVSLAQSTLPSSYNSGMTDFHRTSTPEAIEPSEEVPSEMEHAHGEYLRAVKSTFENTRAGKLVEAGHSLIDLSGWLIQNASQLGSSDVSMKLEIRNITKFVVGLLEENPEAREMRIEMWDQFNTCWLALLQCQKDHTQEMLDQGRPPDPPQNLLGEPFLEQMGNELVRLCDSIERHGLVDYQIGVWEEEIISSMLILGQGFGLPPADFLQF